MLYTLQQERESLKYRCEPIKGMERIGSRLSQSRLKRVRQVEWKRGVEKTACLHGCTEYKCTDGLKSLP